MMPVAQETQRPHRAVWAWAFFTYAVTVTAILLYWNAQGGGLVEQWYADYMGQDGVLSGSGKWRTEEGKAFQTVALLFGFWVYPTAILAAGLLLRHTVRDRGVAPRLLYLAAAVFALYPLYRLEALGLFRAVSSF